MHREHGCQVDQLLPLKDNRRRAASGEVVLVISQAETEILATDDVLLEFFL
jgi:hypothetical protein